MSITFTPIDNASNIESIISNILTGDVSLVIGSVVYIGEDGQASTFTGGSEATGFNSGLLLTSGNGTLPNSNTDTGYSLIHGTPGDPDLDAASATINAGLTADANTLEFKILVSDPSITTVTFNFAFGSDEFPEFSSDFSDVGAIIVNGTNVAFFENGNPLAVIDENLSAGAFIDNTSGIRPVEYDGISRTLSVTVPVIAGENTIKLGVADTNDERLDSGLFVGSIVAGEGDGGGVITQPPVALDDVASTAKETSVTIDVGANDSDPDGVIATFVIDNDPSNGTAVFGAGGALVYTPDAGFVGIDSFTYQITDDDGATDLATVTVNVTGNDDPGPLPTCPVVTRAGTQDGSPAANQTLTGPAGANTFFVSVAADSGKDTISNFGKVDVFVTDAKLQDNNNDGFLSFGSNKLLDLDAGISNGDDTVAFTGLNPNLGLRYLGESCTGVFVYADAVVRPKGAIESSLADDLLKGDVGDASSQVFFFDTALQIDLGTDKIQNFGANDLLVTTTRIFDGNNDGRIEFGSDKALDLSGGGGEVTINAASLTALEYDGSSISNGVEYFVYSRVGSTMTGLDDLLVA